MFSIIFPTLLIGTIISLIIGIKKKNKLAKIMAAILFGLFILAIIYIQMAIGVM